MTNLEIVNMLRKIEPESEEQALSIAKAMQVLLKNNGDDIPDSIKIYLKEIAFDEIVDKPVNRVYDHYEIWCKENCYTPKSKLTFGRAVCAMYQVKSKPVYVNDKIVRVYKFDESCS